MSLPLNVNGTTFYYPEPGNQGWGPDASAWAAAVTVGMLQKAGGLFQLLADVDFGNTYGLAATYYKSRTANIAQSGLVRMERAGVISWRNQANSADLPLGVNSSNELTFNGIPVTTDFITSVSDTSTVKLTVTLEDLTADIVPLSITNSLINAAAAIDLSKLATASALSVIGRSANSTGAHADIAGTNNTGLRIVGNVLGFGTFDLSTALFTGLLPNANQASMAGDVSGNPGANTVDKIKNIDVSIPAHGSAQDGYVLTYVNGSTNLQLKPGSGGSSITWANDLAGSTDTHQYVAAISGNAGAGGTVAINANDLEIGATQTNPIIRQTASTAFPAGFANALTIKAQDNNSTGGSPLIVGGPLVLSAGDSSTNRGGPVVIQSGDGPGAEELDGGFALRTGSTAFLELDPANFSNGIKFGSYNYSTLNDVHIQSNSHVLIRSGGSGQVALRTPSGTDALVVAPTGVVTINSLGTGLVHSSSLGALSSSLLVNSDITTATIALAKLATQAAHTFVANNTGSTASPIAITATQATAELDVFSSTLKGLAPLSGGGTTNFLRADGTWAAPSTGITTIGTINSQTKSANGAVISGTSLVYQTADVSFPGLMSIGTQSIAGAKTFTSALTNSALGLGIVHSSSGGLFSSSAVNLAGADVTGVLPTANQAAQTMIGDVTGTTAASVVQALQSFPISSSTPSTNDVLIFNGSQWAPTVSGASLTIGTIDSNPNANGLDINGGVLTTQYATFNKPGMVSTTGQTFNGQKTFLGFVEHYNNLTVYDDNPGTGFVKIETLITPNILTGNKGFVQVQESSGQLFSTKTPVYSTTTKSSNYTIVSGEDNVIFTDSSGGTFTLTLPDLATAQLGETYIIKDYQGQCSPTNKVIIDATPYNIENGSSTYDMVVPFQSLTFICNGGGGWNII